MVFQSARDAERACEVEVRGVVGPEKGGGGGVVELDSLGPD